MSSQPKPQKPPYGDPTCNGCGVCCMSALCSMAGMLFEDAPLIGQCPALEDIGDRYTCGLVAHPERYAPIRAAIGGAKNLSESAMLVIGTGVGCDAQTKDEPDNPAYRQRMRSKRTRIPEYKIAGALILWMGREAAGKQMRYLKRVAAL